MTIVAYGNATPDFVVECSLANGGYAEMALSGAIGGPVFGLLCGFGVCLIQGCLAEKSGTTDFQIFKNLYRSLGVDAVAWLVSGNLSLEGTA